MGDNTQQIRKSARGTHVIASGSRPNNLFLARTDALDGKQGSFRARELFIGFISHCQTRIQETNELCCVIQVERRAIYAARRFLVNFTGLAGQSGPLSFI